MSGSVARPRGRAGTIAVASACVIAVVLPAPNAIADR
jgi:hypothetical protein